VAGSRLFTSESVTAGHPDKVADQISDAVLDAALAADPGARVACETLVAAQLVVVAGEITTTAELEIDDIARTTIRQIGYDRPELEFDAKSCAVQLAVQEQSPEIARAVDRAADSAGGQAGAGDQGVMFGYATRETPERMPLPIQAAHALAKRLAATRHAAELPFLRPDGKTQVTVRYEDGRPVEITRVLISAQHDPGIETADLERALLEQVALPVLPDDLCPAKHVPALLLVNPAGRFTRGGPVADCGLTGRKIMVDTYGAAARHGGGCFSGKDPSKVDRSGAYAARWVAVNIVAAGLAERCEVQIAYAIGLAEPVSLMVETFGTGALPEERLVEAVAATFDLRPTAISETLALGRPIYQRLAAYGHFGRAELELPWDQANRVEELQAAVRQAGELSR
jgi:S-adenosylmethionine synthetase